MPVLFSRSRKFPVLPLLQNVEAISLCRDRDKLPYVLADAVATALGCGAEVGIFVREPSGESQRYAGSNRLAVGASIVSWQPVLDAVRNDGRLLMCAVDGRNCGAVALPSSE